ncbi:putative Sigma-54 dependent transcription regulator [uncultured Desulfobacterium sp.]|uniref:Putative Sigma-54 dependent transcription regulator n=1 Tax=uncultured Desulfobacterium sp. TaxID=201089 RepID=A0A445N275_9BACT|nr:putative Sigma-54 dependent transcription regulator [uncultured Desulfobacterium sp.]
MEYSFKMILDFFQSKHAWAPGDYEYDDAFCRMLMEFASAGEASIWRLDREGCLHMVYGTNVAPEELSQIILGKGEGISGAAAMSREAISVSDATLHPSHNGRVDNILGLSTHGMISAPIVFKDFVYGVVNILNPPAKRPFSSKCKEYISAAATMYASALAAEGDLAAYETKNKKSPPDSCSVKTIIVGVSSAIQEAIHICLKTGRTDMPVLVRGETGSGKELAARRVHEASRRANGPFVDVNCAALTETLLESELFGHVKGAFSGATNDRQGKFVSASGGTLFLDEIGDMSLACQAKILRALQTKEVVPVGSDKPKKCDARFIAATNFDLLEQVRKGKFREDLYYRLCGIEIFMPPLRLRPEDIYPLTLHFLRNIAAEQKQIDPSMQTSKISPDSISMLMSFHWPGNVRQLEQAIRAAAAICEGDEIQRDDFPLWLQEAMKSNTNHPKDDTQKTIENKEQGADDSYTKGDILQYTKALEGTKYSGTGRWNITAAARLLNMPRKTFYYRLKKLRLTQ